MTFEEWWSAYRKGQWQKELVTLDETVKAAYSAGVQAERERCAKVAEKTFKSVEARYGMTWYLYHKDIAAAIRGQG